MTTKELLAVQKKLGHNFDFHIQTHTFHCKKCGQMVGWEIPNANECGFSSCAEGNSANGICYDCLCEMEVGKNDAKY